MKQQDGGARAGRGSSWSAWRTITTGSVLAQMPTTAVPTAAIPLPTSISRQVPKVPNFTPPDFKQMAEEWRESIRQDKRQRQMSSATHKPDKYAKYLQALQDNDIITEYLHWAFRVFNGGYCDHEEYEPWVILLETLFPKVHGFRVSEEKIVVQTYYSEVEKKEEQQIEPFIGVRKRMEDGSWPLVLLAMGYGQQDPNQLEARFPGVVAAGARMAQRLMEEEGSCGPMVLLVFFSEALLWHTLRAGSAPVRQALLPDVRDKSAERTLLEIVNVVRFLEM